VKKLEAAIAADVDGVDAYLVYADWLQTQNDPRGELIAVQHALMQKPSAKLRKAEAALLAKHDFAGGLEIAVEWHLGFFSSIYFTAREGDKSIDELVRRALALPSARYVRHLAFGQTAETEAKYEPLAKLLSKQKLPFLRSLEFGRCEDDWEVSWTNVGSLAPLYKAFPKLECLRVAGSSIALGSLALPKLRELEIQSNWPGDILTVLSKAKLPKLERLELDLGGSANRIPSLRPILDGRFPALRHLALEWIGPSRDDLEALGTGKTLAKLETLSLASDSITDTKAEMLVAHARRYQHLAKLDLDNNLLSKKGQAAVRALCSSIELGTQQRPDALFEWDDDE
jgi:uncharacterized protein (TIGR02996 family)